jgi:hypothetical protein
MIRPDRLSTVLLGVALSAVGCTGEVQEGGNSPPPDRGPGSMTPTGMQPPTTVPPDPSISPTDSAGPTPLRRLTIFEYNNTIRDLLGTSGRSIEAGAVSVDQASDVGFVNGAAISSSVDARAFMDVTEKLSSGSALANLLPQGCGMPAAGAEEGCARKFIKEFGLRAYRRPLNMDEENDLWTLYGKVRGAEVGGNFQDGIRALIGGMIQSPYFLYRWELGSDPLKDGALVRLNSYEIASRLSYFLTASMPDDQLFAAAGRNELLNADKLTEHARRLLASPKAKDGLRDFVLQWLGVTSLPSLMKDGSFTNYTPEIGAAMLDETSEFFTNLIQGSQGAKLEKLFTAKSSYLNAGLAKLYGVANVTGDNLREVQLDGAPRAGILTQGSFLAAHAEGDADHPVKRGIRILRNVTCLDIQPPTNIEIPPVGDRKPGQTTRARYEEATSAGAVCIGCHGTINPVGFAFEEFDAVGAYRTTEEGKPIDSTGSLQLSGGTINFKNAIELQQGLATASETRDCMTRQFIRYVLRRSDRPEEKGSIAALTDAFQKSGYDLKELLVATTKTHAFTHRQPQPGEGQP